MLRTAALLSTAVLIAAGCIGGDDDDSDAVTKEEFIESADAICAANDEQLEAIGEDLPADATAEEIAALLLDEAMPLFREQIAELRALELPEDDAANLEELWDQLEASADEFEAAIAQDPVAALQTDPFAEEYAFANEYGMQECGNSS